MNTLVASPTQELLAVARRERWNFQVLGQAAMPQKPVRLGDWLITPAQVDTSPIPLRALTRIQAIFAAGIRPQGFVLVHEAPKLLPSQTQEKKQATILAMPQKTWKAKTGKTIDLSEIITTVFSGLGAVLQIVLPILAVIFFGVLFATANGLDPILVAVTEDGYWVEIDRWVNAEGI